MALSRSRRITALVVIVALAFGAGSSVVLAPEADAVVSTSTFTVIDGSVAVSHGAEFVSARVGDLVAAGDTIRTGPGATAEITYFEGSTVRLEAETELVVQSLRTESDGGTVIEVLQRLGRTWHVVTKLIAGSSRYEVRTPASTASVRGTIFAVDVRLEPDGPTATVTTSEGLVIHSAADPATAVVSEVRVAAGQRSTRSPNWPVERAETAAPETLREAPARPQPATHSRAPGQPMDRLPVRVTTAPVDVVGVRAQAQDRSRTTKTLPVRRQAEAP